MCDILLLRKELWLKYQPQLIMGKASGTIVVEDVSEVSFIMVDPQNHFHSDNKKNESSRDGKRLNIYAKKLQN